MSRWLLTLLFALGTVSFTAISTGCEESTEDKVDDAVDDTEDAVDDAVDETEDAVDDATD